jgi:chromate transporter
LRGNTAISSALSAIAAADVDVVMNIAVWFAMHVVFSEVCTLPILGIDVDLPVLALMDWWAAVLSAGAMMAMLRFKVAWCQPLRRVVYWGCCRQA